jgi:putative chitinase
MITEKKAMSLLDTYMDKYGITNPYMKTAILGIILSEGGFDGHPENMNYSKERLPEVWGKFSKTGKVVKKGQGKYNYNELATNLEHKPEDLANFIYGDRLGNGGKNTNDGWTYRGRGLNQLTGKGSYKKLGKQLGVDLINNPELLDEDPELQAHAAVLFIYNRINKTLPRLVKNNSSYKKRFEDYLDYNNIDNLEDASFLLTSANAGFGNYPSKEKFAKRLRKAQPYLKNYNLTDPGEGKSKDKLLGRESVKGKTGTPLDKNPIVAEKFIETEDIEENTEDGEEDIEETTEELVEIDEDTLEDDLEETQNSVYRSSNDNFRLSDEGQMALFGEILYPKGNIVSPYGDSWEYLKEDDDYFTRKKGTENWIKAEGVSKDEIKDKLKESNKQLDTEPLNNVSVNDNVNVINNEESNILGINSKIATIEQELINLRNTHLKKINTLSITEISKGNTKEEKKEAAKKKYLSMLSMTGNTTIGDNAKEIEDINADYKKKKEELESELRFLNWNKANPTTKRKDELKKSFGEAGYEFDEDSNILLDGKSMGNSIDRIAWNEDISDTYFDVTANEGRGGYQYNAGKVQSRNYNACKEKGLNWSETQQKCVSLEQWKKEQRQRFPQFISQHERYGPQSAGNADWFWQGLMFSPGTLPGLGITAATDLAVAPFWDDMVEGAFSAGNAMVHPIETTQKIISSLKENGGSIEMDLNQTQVDEYVRGGYILEELHEGGEPHKHPHKDRTKYIKRVDDYLDIEGAMPLDLVYGNKKLGIPKMGTLSGMRKIPEIADYFFDPSGDQYDKYVAERGNPEERKKAEKRVRETYLANVGRTEKEDEEYENKKIKEKAIEDTQYRKEQEQLEMESGQDIQGNPIPQWKLAGASSPDEYYKDVHDPGYNYLGEYANIANELTGIPSISRTYDRLKDDPLQLAKDVGTTIKDIQTLPFNLAKETYDYKLGDGKFEGENLVDLHSLGVTGDVVGSLPWIGGGIKGLKTGSKYAKDIIGAAGKLKKIPRKLKVASVDKFNPIADINKALVKTTEDLGLVKDFKKVQHYKNMKSNMVDLQGQKYITPEVYNARLKNNPNSKLVQQVESGEIQVLQRKPAKSKMDADGRIMNQETDLALPPEKFKIVDEQIKIKLDRMKSEKGRKLLKEEQKAYINKTLNEDGKLTVKEIDEMSEAAAQARIDEVENLFKNKNYAATEEVTAWHRKSPEFNDLYHESDYYMDKINKTLGPKNKDATIGFNPNYVTKKNPAVIHHEAGHIGTAGRDMPIEKELIEAVGTPTFTKNLIAGNEMDYETVRAYNYFVKKQKTGEKLVEKLRKLDPVRNQSLTKGQLFDKYKNTKDVNFPYLANDIKSNTLTSGEPVSYAQEFKQTLLDQGLIKDWFDPITEDILIQSQKINQQNPKGYFQKSAYSSELDEFGNVQSTSRILDFTDPSRYKQLAKALNKVAPVVAAPVVATSMLDNKKDGGFVLDLSPKQVEQYKRGGYILEEMHDGDELPKAENGIINYSGPRNYNYLLDDAYSKYPGLEVMKDDLEILGDTSFTREATGVGDIEFFGKDDTSFTYPTGFTYPNPNPGGYGIPFNPKTNNSQGIALDMLHGMDESSPKYKELKKEFGKAYLNSKFKKDFKDQIKWMKEKVGEDKYNEWYDGKDSKYFDHSYLDGIIRNLLYEGTPEDFKRDRYWDKAQEEYLSDPKMKETFGNLKKYLTTKPVTPDKYVEAALTLEEADKYREGGYVLEEVYEDDPGTGKSYTVKSGDTFNAIAYANGITPEELKLANSGISYDKLSIGQVINIPKKESVAKLATKIAKKAGISPWIKAKKTLSKKLKAPKDEFEYDDAKFIDEIYMPELLSQENAGRAGYDPETGLWYPHKAPEEGGGYDIFGGHKIGEHEDFSEGITTEQGHAQMRKDFESKKKNASKYIDKTYGEGTFEGLPVYSQALLTDYEYNVAGGIGKFPNFAKGVVNNDKDLMLKEYVRYSDGKPLGRRNDFTKDWINKYFLEEKQEGGGFIEAYLSPKEVKQYVDGGYILDEII